MSDPESWLSTTIPRRWPDARVGEISPLRGDASTRRFWRVRIIGAPDAAPATAIAVDLGPDDLPLYARVLKLLPEAPAEPPWINVHRFLTSIGAPVPRLYSADFSARLMLVEDIGEMPLFAAAQSGHAGDLFRLAADQLLRLHIDGTSEVGPDCIASRIAYDERLFRWELDQFVAYGLPEIAPGAPPDSITAELDDLASRLGMLPRVFSHRDYHGHNLFVQTDKNGAPVVRVIDFQDALMAPAAQDLAVLLTTRDTSKIVTPIIERRVLDYYYAAQLRRSIAVPPLDEFMSSYRLCVLQHALKVIGRFIFLEREGKTGYSAFIPFAREQARRMLAQGSDFPNLRAAISQ